VVGASLAIRWPGFTQGGFASHDVGGILYEAMVLERGGLPYVDTVELKAPGTFYIAALLAGSDIAALQVAANVTALLSLLALAAIAWRLWGGAAAVVAAIVYALHDAALDRMDANYVTWAQLPQILAMAAGLAATRATRRAPWWWALAGAMCGAAALCKQPAGVILVPVLLWAGRRAPAVVAGFVMMHAPVLAHYAAHGQLAAFVGGYAFNPWGLAYITQRGAAGPLTELWEGALATVHTLALPLALAGFAVVSRLSRGPVPRDRTRRTGWTG
jgi:4-amino-4-deoxy-L-arabinose transferase-like glycosyltransferase